MSCLSPTICHPRMRCSLRRVCGGGDRLLGCNIWNLGFSVQDSGLGAQVSGANLIAWDRAWPLGRRAIGLGQALPCHPPSGGLRPAFSV